METVDNLRMAIENFSEKLLENERQRILDGLEYMFDNDMLTYDNIVKFVKGGEIK